MFKTASIFALSLSLLPAILHAQSLVSDEAAMYRARIDSLLPVYEAARRALTVADSVREVNELAAQREPLDSILLTPFIVVAPRSHADKVFPLMRRTIEERASLLAQLESAPRITLLVEADSFYRAFRSMNKAPRHHIVSLRGDDGERRRRIAANAVDDALLDLAPPAVREWMLDGRMTHGREAKHAYRALATSPSGMTKRCYDGVVEECVNALGLGTPYDSTRGYTNEQIRTLAVRARGTNFRAYAHCRDAGIMEQCFAILRSYGGPPMPLGRIPRANFLVFALERGGPGAMARLTASRSDATSSIESAAGTDVRTLAREWRENIEAARPVANAGTGAAGAATLIWAVIAMGFALRSTRRRL